MKSLQEIIKEKRDQELIDMVENPSAYQEDFSLEAFKELQFRNIEFNDEKIQKLISKNDQIRKKVKEEKLKKEFIIRQKPRIFNLIALFIFGAVILRFIKISLMHFTFSIGFLNIPFLPDILNIISLFLILYLFVQGFFKIRLVFLFGFLINTIVAVFFMVKFNLSVLDVVIYSIHISFKLIALILFFSKPINNWISLVDEKHPSHKKFSQFVRNDTYLN